MLFYLNVADHLLDISCFDYSRKLKNGLNKPKRLGAGNGSPLAVSDCVGLAMSAQIVVARLPIRLRSGSSASPFSYFLHSHSLRSLRGRALKYSSCTARCARMQDTVFRGEPPCPSSAVAVGAGYRNRTGATSLGS